MRASDRCSRRCCGHTAMWIDIRTPLLLHGREVGALLRGTTASPAAATHPLVPHCCQTPTNQPRHSRIRFQFGPSRSELGDWQWPVR